MLPNTIFTRMSNTPLDHARPPLAGLHHVTAVTADAAGNVDFYTRVLGLRLVKKTVNQDDVSAYHLFYGDAVGNPGTEVTFFDWGHAAPRRPGVNEIARLALRVRGAGVLDWWAERLTALGVAVEPVATEFGRATLAFADHEGQRFALVDDTDDPEPGLDVHAGGEAFTAWSGSTVPAEYAVRGLGPVALTVQMLAPLSALLTTVLGFRVVGREAVPGVPDVERVAFATGAGGARAELHVTERRDLAPARLGRGGVHHLALRVRDDAAQRAWLEHLTRMGVRTSGLVDRFYFESVYFREPNGILFELATDGPGFATDEDAAHLGERLSLPPFLEGRRAEIERGLRAIDRR